ncbi:MAG: hypothetical protein ACI92S_005234 [Planctomycetaceae bacterium]|jgi:hypothetical protein
MTESPFPDKLRINWFEDYHTHHLGELPDRKLAWGIETFAFINSDGSLGNHNTGTRVDYAILFIFDRDGQFLSSNHWSSRQTESSSYDELEKLVAARGGITYRDIEIIPFMTTIDDVEFGLVRDPTTEMISFEPH